MPGGAGVSIKQQNEHAKMVIPNTHMIPAPIGINILRNRVLMPYITMSLYQVKAHTQTKIGDFILAS